MITFSPHAIRHKFAAPLIALVALGSLGSFQSASHLLPTSDGPLGPGTTPCKYVAIVRERGQKPQPDWSDMQATIWEIQLEGKAPYAARRISLGLSHWTPTPIGGTPAMLRWQVSSPNGSNGYHIKILGVDFRDFTVKELLAVDQAFEIGYHGNRIYLKTSEGQRVMDRKTGALTPQTPEIELLASTGGKWLVRANGSVCMFDPKAGKVTKTFKGIPGSASSHSRGQVEWDGGTVAIQRGGYLDEHGEPIEYLSFGEQGIVYRKLHLWDLLRGVEHTRSVRMQATGGSGIGVIPSELRVEVHGDRVRYTERLPLEGKHASLSDFDFWEDSEWVHFNLTTGKEVERSPIFPHENTDSFPPDREVTLPGPLFDRTFTIPAHLQVLLAESPIRSWGLEQDLAYAFLMYEGIDLELQKKDTHGNPVGVCRFDAVCALSDWSELLVLHDGYFYDCNLKTQEVRKRPAPKALSTSMVSLHAIR